MYAERIKKIRTEKGKTQTEIAKVLDISYQAYAHYEKGRREPTPDQLIKLADYYGITVDYLLGHNKTAQGWTEADQAQGIGKYPTYLSDREKELIEIGSEILRIHGEQYYDTVISMLKALITNN